MGNEMESPKSPETQIAPAGSARCWRLRAGFAVLILSLALPLGGIALSVFGWHGLQSALLAFLLVGGLPEILCLVAIAVLGKDHFGPAVSAVRRTRLPVISDAPASGLRYYVGLAGCLLNGIPVWIYAYAPEVMPGGTDKFIILAAADLVFIYSVFLMGGEFWEKFRRLFVWEGPALAEPKK